MAFSVSARAGWGAVEPGLWCAVAVAAALLYLPEQRVSPLFSNDSFQYLSAAHHLRSDYRYATSLVHYDTERMHGVIPAPLTWFPPGYPMAIAALSITGLDLEKSALAISVACFALVAAGLWRLMQMLETGLWAARAAVVCWLLSSQALLYSVSALSESMFVALGLASLLLVLRTGYTGPGARSAAMWLGAVALAGVSYWVRYAGIIWAGAFGILLSAHLVARGSKRRPALGVAALAALLVALVIAPLMVRNHRLVGDWRGSNNSEARSPASLVVAETVRSACDLVLGAGTRQDLLAPVALLGFGAGGLCLLGFRRRTGSSADRPKEAVRMRANVLIVLAAAAMYAAGIVAVCFNSMLVCAPRYLLPVLPHAIALAVWGASWTIRRVPPGTAPRTVALALAMCALAGYAGANIISCRLPVRDRFLETERALAEPDASGQSLRLLVERELAPGEVIAATNGQATGYVLGHPALCLAEQPYTTLAWTEAELRKEMARFGASLLLVFRSGSLDQVVEMSPTVRALAGGRSAPWLHPVAFNRHVYVYHAQPQAPQNLSSERLEAR
jgi:hypothetical protein